MRNMNKITVNGKEYNSLQDVPEEYKVMFGDKNNNGIPDFVEGILAGTNDLKSAMHVSGNSAVNANFTSFFYNGNQYNDINQLPPEAKQMVENGLSKLEKTGMKISQPFTDHESIQTQPDISAQNPSNPTQQDVMQEEGAQLSHNFKFRVVMTSILFILAVIYIFWLMKLI
jgi:hypothetical protein